MSLFIKIPYRDKEKAKLLGAKWNPELKSWYVKNKADYPKFTEWIVGNSEQKCIICDYFYIVEKKISCPCCGNLTKIIVLGIENFLQLRYHKNDNNFPFIYEECLTITSCFLENVGEEFELFLKNNFLYFPSYSNYLKRLDFMNHCFVCMENIDNYYLFSHKEKDNFYYIGDVGDKLKLIKVNLKSDIIIDVDLYFEDDDIDKWNVRYTSFLDVIMTTHEIKPDFYKAKLIKEASIIIDNNIWI